MAFNTKRPLSDAKYIQCSTDTLTLSGDTCVGYAEYIACEHASYTLRSIPDVEYVTGITSGLVTNDTFTGYTASTETRLTGIENDVDNLAAISGITNVSITGVTNGLTKVGSHDAKLGGALTENTAIDNSSFNLTISGASLLYDADYSPLTAREIPDAAYVTGITSGLVTNDTFTGYTASTDTRLTGIENDVDNLGAISAITEASITAATNGLTKVGNHTVKLGGALTENTAIDNSSFSLTISGDSITYDADYAPFTARQIPDAAWVTGCTSANITTANNGLTKDDCNIRLGGTLTGDTKVDLSTFGIVLGDTGSVSSGASSVVLAEGIAGGACSVAIANGCAYGADSIAFADGQAQCDQTFAFGTGSIASGASSAAFGSNACTTACGAFAFGVDVMATGQQSVAFGSGATSSGPNSFTFGCGAIASGDNALAFGSSCAIGNNSWAAGGNSCANGQGAVIIAGCGESNGYGSFAFGNRVCADANGAFAFGSYVNALGLNSFAFGIGTSTRPIVASGVSAINFSNNTAAQKEGHGADAPYSVIVGGINHHIDEKVGVNTGAAIIGRYGTTGIVLSGAVNYEDHTVVPHFAIWGTPTDDPDGQVLVWDPVTKKVGKTTISALGGITGATNGLDTYGQDVGLGGILTETTTVISGDNKNYSFGTAASPLNLYCQNANSHIVSADACAYFRTEGTGAGLIVDARNNGTLVLKAQGGAVGGDDFTSAVGISMDFNGNDFTVHDNRAGSSQVGIEYNADYSDNYSDRSLVDKAYVDSVAAGLDAKDAVNVATTVADGDIDVTGGTFVSGTTLDGVVVEDGWRVLVKNQTDAIENGIWVYSASTSAFTRAEDFDGTPAGEVSNGAYCLVITGDTLANSQWVVTTPDPITIGTTEINWSLLSQQLGIQAGTGITVTTVSSNNTISVKLASNSALSFGPSNGLRVDSTIAGLGLTHSAGVIDANIENAAASGNEIRVQIDTGGTDVLMVDSDDVASALGTPITTANNGLTKADNIVSLGGDLTGNTTINGTAACYNFSLASLGQFNVTFDGPATITDQGASGGLKYAANYCNEFTARSLPDVEYVTGLTTQGITTANNGLTKEGQNVRLGGTLTGDTTVDTNGNNIVLGTSPNIIGGQDSIVLGSSNNLNGNYAFVGGNGSSSYGTGSFAFGGGAYACGSYSVAFGQNTCAQGYYSASFGNQTRAVGSSAFAIGQSTYACGNESFAGGNYRVYANGNESFAFGKCISAYGERSFAFGYKIYNCGVNSLAVGKGVYSGGNNYFLRVEGNSAFNFSESNSSQVLGHGALADNSAILGGLNHHIDTGNTRAAIIGGNGIKLTGSSYIDYTAVANLAIFSTPDTGDFSDGILVWDSADNKVKQVASTVIGGITGASNGLDVVDKEVKLGGALTEATAIDNSSFDLTISGTSALYDDDYSSTYVARSIPDAAFVTGCTSANETSANNGITKESDGNFVLGGALTGNTKIDATINNHTFALGYNACATGSSSIAMGYAACAFGTYSVALGQAEALGEESFAAGGGALACGNYSFAAAGGGAFGASSIGIIGQACDTNATAIGQSTVASGSCSLAMVASIADCNGGIAIGWNDTRSTGENAIAIGQCACSQAFASIAMGSGPNASSNGSIALGTLNGAYGAYSAVIGGNSNSITTSQRAVLLGGTLINIGAGYDDHAIVPNLAINTTPSTGAFDDGVLVWDSADKKVKQVASTVIGGITGASNGLDVVDKEVILGGNLTENTTISGGTGTYDLTLTGIDNFITSADTLDLVSPSGVNSGFVNMTGTTVSIGQTISAQDFKIEFNGGVGTVTDAIGSKGLVYAGDYSTNGVIDPRWIPDYASVTALTSTNETTANNGITKESDGNFVLGGDLTGDTTVGLAGFSLVLGSGSTIANYAVVNNLAIEDAPDAGDAVADAILVWDSADKKVKQVSASELGEDNNIYSYSGVSGTTINLTSGSSYVILVDTTLVPTTINLPASPQDGQAFKIKDKIGNALNNNITVSSTDGIDGSTTASLNTDYGALEIMYSAADDEWYTLSFIN